VYNRTVQSDNTLPPAPPDEVAESPVAQAAADQQPLTEQAQFDLEMMRNRLAAQLNASKDPLEEKLPEPKASAKYWVSIAFSLAALFLVAYLFANIMRDAIQSQPVTAGLEEDVIQGDEEVDVTSEPRIEVTIVP
jgi:hypothetical protein